MRVALPEKGVCTGCTACQAICPKEAIRMAPDGEGFSYPQIDEAKCVGCGKCLKVCHAINPAECRIPLAVYAVKARDAELRLASSSGGVFSMLANDVLAKHGVVWGAAFNHTDWHVYHLCVDSVDALAELRGSKYVQSDMEDSIRQVAKSLSAGGKIMFTGTPCQIAGLRRYLTLAGVDTANLLLVDIVCHAVPSPVVWKKYLNKRIHFAYNGAGEPRDIRAVNARRKDFGWKQYSMALSFANGTEYVKVFREDTFMRGFLAELFNRPSCHRCPAKELKSSSDITIADYWGVDTRFPGFDDDKGVSLVLVNTAKGRVAFDSIASDADLLVSDFAHACIGNSPLIVPTKPHRKGRRSSDAWTISTSTRT